MKKQITLSLLIIVGILYTLSCKQNNNADNNSNGNGNTPAVIGVNLGNIATAFSELDLNGLTFNLEDYKGKVILLNFSAMWCGPCRYEAGELMELYNKYKERGFEVVQVIFQDENEDPADNTDLARWKAEFGLNFVILTDLDYSSVNTYNVKSLPTNLVINRDFIIKYRQSGFDKATVENEIEKHI